jgi:translation elongation factor EF-G
MQLVTQLQDLLSEVDYAHAEREIKGRSLKARYRRVTASERLRLLKFSPFPSRVVNTLKYIRAKAYELLNDYCVKVTSLESGFYRENVYILSENLAEKFVSEIRMLDDELNDVRRFIEGFDYSSIELLLSRYDLELPKKSFNIPSIRVDLLPIALEYAIEEWARKSENVKQLLVQKKEELIKNAVEDIRKRLEPILKAMEGETKLRKLKERLEQIRTLAEGIGLKALSETVIAPLIEATENPKILEGKKPSEFVSGRIESLLR